LDQLSPDCSFNLQALASEFASNTEIINAYGINFSDLQSALSIYEYKFVDSCGIMNCGTSGDPKIEFELEAGTPARSHTVIAWMNLYEDKPDKSGYMMFDQHFKFRDYLVSKYGEDNVIYEF
jgi:hypothetical protein